MIGVLAGLAGKLLPEAGKILDELVTSGEEKAAAKQKLEELFVSKKKNYSQTISFIELDLSDTEQMEKSINNYQI